MMALHPPHPDRMVAPNTSLSHHRQAAWLGLALSVLFILYQTTIPFQFEFSTAQLQEGWHRATIVPYTNPEDERVSRADIIGNVALFVPLGFFLAICPVGRRSGRRRLLALTALGALLSFAIESAQLLSPYRFAQTTDVIDNALGCLTGALLAAGGGRDLFDRTLEWARQKLRTDPGALVVLLLTGAILMGALLPLNLSITLKSLQQHLAEAQWRPFRWPLAPTSRLVTLVGLFKGGWLYAFWGAAAAARLSRRRYPFLLTLAWGAALAVAAEASQLFVVSQHISVTEPLVGWCGAAVGAFVLLWGRQLGLGNRALGFVFGTGYIVYLISDSISPLAPTVVEALRAGHWPGAASLSFQLVPFQAVQALPRIMALGDWLARFTRFVPLGAAIRLGLPRRDLRLRIAAGAALVILLLEILVARYDSWYGGDITEVLLAWAGMAAGWWAGRRLARELRDLPGGPARDCEPQEGEAAS